MWLPFRLSQIQAMNFASHHTVSHRSLKDYISHHPLHQHSCLHWSRTHLQTITQSPSPNHTHTHTLHKPWTFSHSLPSIVSQSTYKAFSLVSLVCLPVFRFRPCLWIILSALPTGLSLPIADPRLPKDYSSVLSMPYPFASARPCLYWPCMWIKSLHLDPNVSSSPSHRYCGYYNFIPIGRGCVLAWCASAVWQRPERLGIRLTSPHFGAMSNILILTLTVFFV